MQIWEYFLRLPGLPCKIIAITRRPNMLPDSSIFCDFFLILLLCLSSLASLELLLTKSISMFETFNWLALGCCSQCCKRSQARTLPPKKTCLLLQHCLDFPAAVLDSHRRLYLLSSLITFSSRYRFFPSGLPLKGLVAFSYAGS